MFQVKPLKMSNKIFFLLLILGLFGGFRGFLRPCFAMRRVKRQQVKVQFWIWGPRTVYNNMTCTQIYFSKITPPYSAVSYFPFSTCRTLVTHRLWLCSHQFYFLNFVQDFSVFSSQNIYCTVYMYIIQHRLVRKMH